MTQSLDAKTKNSMISVTVGKRLRRIRTGRGLTLAQVKDLSGISISTLSKLEKGRTSLSFNSMLQLIEGLNIPISSLIGPRRHQLSGRRSVTREGEGRVFEAREMTFEVLCGELRNKRNVFWKVTVSARSIDEYDEFKKHPGEEFIHVLEGRLDLHTELYEPVTLGAGDSIFFDSEMGHAYVSSGPSDAVILMSNTIARDQLEGFLD